MSRLGVPIVISAPSGCGKTTLCHNLIRQLSGVEFSISYTTRALRGEEKDGVDYHFVSNERFDQLVSESALLEWAQVFDQRYGTGLQITQQRLAAGVDILFDIDVQGGRQISEKLPETLLIFILPPSMEELERRLRGRKSDSEEQIQRRLQAARDEIEAASFYPNKIINDDLGRATAELVQLLKNERHRLVGT
jgi:guanylate kinase